MQDDSVQKNGNICTISISKLLNKEYLHKFGSNKTALVLKILARYCAPAYGLPYPVGMKRISAEHKAKVLELFENYPTSKLPELKSDFHKVLENSHCSPSERDEAKSRFKSFYEWLVEGSSLEEQHKEALGEERYVFRNVRELIDPYAKQAKRNNAASMLLSAIARYIAPQWGHPYPKAKRLSPPTKESLLKFLESVEVQQLRNLLMLYHSATKHKKSNEISSYTSTVKDFYRYCLERKVFKPGKDPYEEEAKKEIVVYLRPSKGKAGREKNKARKPHVKPYALMTNGAGHRQKAGVKRQPELLYKDDYINDALQRDIDQLVEFRKKHGMKQPTIKIDTGGIMRFLGWLHRVEGIPLADLRLADIIKFAPLVPDLQPEDSPEEGFRKQFQTEQELQRVTSSTLDRIFKYFEWKRKEHQASNATLEIEIKWLICVAKSLYEKEIWKSDKYVDY